LKLLAMIFLVLWTPFFANAARPTDVSILSECLWNKELYYEDADCNDLYHKYNPKKVKAAPAAASGKVRIGGFNLYRLGLRDTRFKDLNMIAGMIDKRWDIVTITEVHHNMALNLRANAEAVRSYLDGMDSSLVKKSYHLPGYLSLLINLQKLDSSWGLILSSTGHGRTHELSGFLYRKSVVQPMASKYCEALMAEQAKKPISIYGEIHEAYRKGFQRYDRARKRPFVKPEQSPVACHLALRGMENEYFSRVPLVGRFKAGNFDFSLMSHHARFNQPARVKAKCMTECRSLQHKMEEHIGLASGVADLPGSQVARFFEANALIKGAGRVAEAEDDQDVIAAGDFNLEYGPEASRGRNEVWDYLLKKWSGAKIFIEGRTSLSKKAGPSQSYDHFIFNTKKEGASECSTETIQAVDFTDENASQAAYFKKLFDPSAHEEIVENYLKSFNEQYRIINNVPYPLYLKNFDQVEEYLQSFPDEDAERMERDYFRATRRKFKDCTNGETLRGQLFEARRNDFFCRILWQVKGATTELLKDKQKFRPYTELVSDHMPIEMSCKTN